MKLFAPTANWDMTRSDSWWPMIGSAPSSAGIRVSQEVAMTYAAAFAATRVITESLASLPLNIMEKVDERTTRKAVDHPLHRSVHDMPNPEQDIVCFLDMQTALQVNWGNAYQEKQYDQAGNIVALWPIHASRIPVSNIMRNPTEPDNWRHIVVGQPGEIVYYVNNDDGTTTAIPASDMLHVPGVMSANGITGKSIALQGAESLGIAIATDRHAGAFFRNGAVSNIALKSKKVVGKEVAQRLREQWQQSFAGVHNHYKTLLLEDEIEPHPFSIAPEASQLIEARKFGVNDVARLWKVPPHMIGDLSRATWSNIEMEEISFVVHTMLPWIRRWEKAMFRQLLTREEQKRFYFKFNIMGLLRGDSAARSLFYKALFDMGALSPNDIREREDMNPIEEGDQYFVPGNNLVPLDKISEMAQAGIDKLNEPTPAPQQQPPTEDAANIVKRLVEHEVRVVAACENAAKSQSDAVQQAFEKALNVVVERVASQIPEIPDTSEWMDAVNSSIVTIEGRVEELVKSIPSTTEFVSAATPLVQSAVKEASESATEAAKQVEIAQNTAEIEEIAAKQAIFDQKQAEFEAKSAAEREATRRVFTLALKREIDKMMEHEFKWLSNAIENPSEWKQSRTDYYGRFKRYFVANLGEYASEAASCGIILDLEWGAHRYSGDSITDLKSLDGFAADNYHDKLKEHVNIFRKNQWTERSKSLAADMVERGVKLFKENHDGNATNPD